MEVINGLSQLNDAEVVSTSTDYSLPTGLQDIVDARRGVVQHYTPQAQDLAGMIVEVTGREPDFSSAQSFTRATKDFQQHLISRGHLATGQDDGITGPVTIAAGLKAIEAKKLSELRMPAVPGLRGNRGGARQRTTSVANVAIADSAWADKADARQGRGERDPIKTRSGAINDSPSVIREAIKTGDYVATDYSNINVREAVTSSISGLFANRTIQSNEIDRKSIANIQRELQKQGFNPGPIDGLHGQRTQTAVDLAISRGVDLSEQVVVGGRIARKENIVVESTVSSTRRGHVGHVGHVDKESQSTARKPSAKQETRVVRNESNFNKLFDKGFVEGISLNDLRSDRQLTRTLQEVLIAVDSSVNVKEWQPGKVNNAFVRDLKRHQSIGVFDEGHDSLPQVERSVNRHTKDKDNILDLRAVSELHSKFYDLPRRKYLRTENKINRIGPNRPFKPKSKANKKHNTTARSGREMLA